MLLTQKDLSEPRVISAKVPLAWNPRWHTYVDAQMMLMLCGNAYLGRSNAGALERETLGG